VPENLTDTIAVAEPDWKLIFRTQPARARLKRAELYHRRVDRTDGNDVAGQRPEIAARLETYVTKWIDVQKQVRKQLGRGGTSNIDAQTLERLRSLGYVGGAKK